MEQAPLISFESDDDDAESSGPMIGSLFDDDTPPAQEPTDDAPPPKFEAPPEWLPMTLDNLVRAHWDSMTGAQCIAAAVALVAVLCTVVWLGVAVVVASPPPTPPARHAHSRDFTCAEVANNVIIGPLMARARHKLGGARPCTCAPLLDSTHRYTVVNASGDVVDMFNARIDRTWTGRVDGVARYDVTARSLVTEQQRDVYPDRTEPVRNVRYNTLLVRYVDCTCAPRRLIVNAEHAWCVAACDDLFEGRTVYDTAAIAAAQV